MVVSCSQFDNKYIFGLWFLPV